MAHPDLPAEQAHVDHAYERLGAMRAGAAEMLQSAFGERGTTFQSFTERDIRVRNSLSRLEQLQIGREALVFGRSDQGNGSADASGPPGTTLDTTESFHIGRLAISDVDQEPLVVDWRAPIAEPFYRATGAHPMGLNRRRHFLTDGPRVMDLEDELFEANGAGEGVGLGLSGSQVLLAALERSRTGRMRDIVATVQREQDEIIRGPLGGLLVVQGGPGTGKTAVALHRAAYLLYTHRFPLERQRVLVVGPSPVFLRYIEHVLPSLGESGVELSTISGLFPDVVASADEDVGTARLKGDPRMARLLANAVANRQRPLRRPVSIPYGPTFLRLSEGMSAQIVAAAKRRPGTHNARRRFVETLLWRHLQCEVERRVPPTGGHGDEEARPPTPTEIGKTLRRVPEVAEALDRMWPTLTPEQLLHDLFGAGPLIDLAARELLSEAERHRLHRPRSVNLEEVAWTRADIALLDEARALLGPRRRKVNAASSGQLNGSEDPDDIASYGHIVVDEAQDLSPMELRMLARRSLSGSMTVVGDIAQATGSWAPAKWDQVVAHLPASRGWKLAELTVNYRTPSEIMELAGRVLEVATPGARVPEAVRSTGEAPGLVTVGAPASPGDASPGEGALGDTVAALAARELAWASDAGGAAPSQAEGTVAVIVPPSLRERVAEALQRGGLVFGTVGQRALESSLSLFVVEEAKGLEFDSVVVVEPARLASESIRGMRALYVAMTRAPQRLTIV
ncbi:MAG: HelD family protein, partial [Acidimicrobiales bacterium]